MLFAILAQIPNAPVPSGNGATWYVVALIVLTILGWVDNRRLLKPIRNELRTNGGLPKDVQDRPHGTTKEETILGVVETLKQNEKFDRQNDKLDLMLEKMAEVVDVKRELASLREEVKKEIGGMSKRIDGLAETSADVVKTVANASGKVEEIGQKVKHLDAELTEHKQNNEKWKKALLATLKREESGDKPQP